VELAFTDDALDACAEDAIKHKTGARGLRTVLEDTLLDVMYEIPSRADVTKCVVTAESIKNHQRPLLLSRTGDELPSIDDEDVEEADVREDASA
jgi:ATP-dependent Clp protease ATP-binding subunit ClpX